MAGVGFPTKAPIHDGGADLHCQLQIAATLRSTSDDRDIEAPLASARGKSSQRPTGWGSPGL
jgi:hypothetical protein